MAQTLADIAIKLSADMVEFENDMGRAARIANKQSAKMKRDLKVAMAAIATASIAAGGALAALVKTTANTADAIQKMSQRLGVSTEFLSQMRHTTELTGVSFNTFSTGLQRMTRRLAEAAATGQGEAVPALKALGVSIESIQGLAPEKQFMILADAMDEVKNQGDKVRIAMKLFDTEGVALVQTMDGGSKAIAAMNKEADAFGLTISQDAANAAAHFNDELTRLQNQFKGMAEDIGRDLMPRITELITEFRNSDFVKNFGENVKGVIKSVAGLTDQIVFLTKAIGGLLIVRKVSSLIQGMIAVAGLSTGAFSLAGKAVAGYTLQLGVMQKTMLATKGIATGLMSVIGGPFGLALMGGYAVWKGISAEVEARAERIGELAKVSDEAAEAMKRFHAAASGSADEAQSLKTIGGELDTVNQKINELIEKRKALQSSYAVQSGDIGARVNVRVIDEQINALEKQKRSLEAIAVIAPKLKPIWEGIDKVGQAWADGVAKATSWEKSVIQQSESVNKWIESAEKMVENLKEENENYGLSAKAIARLNGERQKLLTSSADQKKRIDEVTKAYVAQIQKQEAQVKATEAQIAAQEALDKLNQDYASLVQSLETPMETLNRTTEEQVDIIGRYILANQGNEEAMSAALEVLKRLDAQYKDSEAEIKAAADATDEFRVALERLGVPSHVLQQLHQVAALMGKLGNMGNIFGGGFNDGFGGLTGALQSLPDLIKKAVEGADIELDLKGNFGRQLQGFFGGYEGEMASSIANRYADIAQVAIGAWRGAEGKDSAGQLAQTATAILAMIPGWGQAIAAIATAVDGLTGGKLFGTAFEFTGAGVNASIGAGGVTGEQWTQAQRERSFFRGTQTRIDTSPLDAQFQEVLQKILDGAEQIATASSQALGVDVPNLVSGSIEQEFDADGNLVSSISRVLGRTYNEGIEEFGMRVSAENIIASLNSAFEQIEVTYTEHSYILDDYGNYIGGFNRVMTRMVDEADFIANRWRMDAETFLDGAQMLLAAGTDIVNGVGLFDTLTEVADTIEAMQKPNETLLDAYSRISEATSQLTDALSVMGLSLDNSRQEFVQFAADISDAAGGVERSQALWQAYFDTFYSAEELAQNALDNAITSRDSELADIGLDSSVTNEEFRRLFEDVLPTLSADMVVEWLEAAESIGVVIDAEAQLAQIRGKNADDLAEMMAEIGSDLEDMNLSPFAKRLKDIKNAFNEQIKTAKELGASERELAMIQTYASRQIQQAIRALESDIKGALADLYGTELDQINEQIASLESQSSAISNISRANENRYADELRAIQNIQGYLNSLLLNDALSPLNPMEQLAEAQSQFDEMYALGKTGDIDALNALPALADTLLGLGRDVWASGDNYTDLFDMVRASLGDLGVTRSPSGEDTGTQIVAQNAQLIELQKRANELQEQQDLSNVFDAAMAIAVQIGELSSVTNESFAQLAERLGLPVEQFLSDLGISLDNVTVETTIALAEIAATMGINISELAASVGISLGDLADDQSLLNDALEATILGLPQGIANDLDAMLTAIEKTTNPEEREARLLAMEEYIASLPADQANLLAPFFENIDPTTNASQQLDQMTQLNQTNQSMDAELKAMRLEQQQQSTEANTGQDAQIRELKDLNRNIIRLMDIVGVA